MELKPCPFCGTEDIQIYQTFHDPLSLLDPPGEVTVTCPSCGLGGYTEETEDEAIKAWNERKGEGDE